MLKLVVALSLAAVAIAMFVFAPLAANGAQYVAANGLGAMTMLAAICLGAL